MLIVITTNVKAVSYTSDDNYTMPTQYHDLFNNYFNHSKSYQYFSYRCTYGSTSRNCYYGIDSDFNYLKVTYENTGSYNYNLIYEKGIDKDFKVNGINIFKKNPDPNYSILYAISFIFTLFVILRLVDKFV